ncbi:hypothetical protein EG68_10366 [Paragonimus skrjabini miyazakii]|uniref:Breast cancer metastasis-suppressor 1-like protein n=1 Tax=Paragonimus skrjabini miyazakii TaxID=59628 RepID=A0A8S9YRC0_9TREM|nr:hypothetical protein EG68_10366 [Paragonimus skrjabini miyazakii]
MATDVLKVNSVVASTSQDDEERPHDEEYIEQEARSEPGEEELTEAEIETLRRELAHEVCELEWEFKQAKETLYNERIAQVENKLSQARSGTAPEFLHVVSLVEETYRIRHQVAECRRDFAIEVADKELDNELQIAQCNTNERLLVAEEQIRLRLQENLCKLQIQKASAGFQTTNSTGKQRRTRSSEMDSNVEPSSRSILSPLDTNFYLPSPNLEPRKKPVTLSPTAPRLVYQLSEEDIRADVEAIMAAVKEHKLATAMAEMNGGKRFC